MKLDKPCRAQAEFERAMEVAPDGPLKALAVDLTPILCDPSGWPGPNEQFALYKLSDHLLATVEGSKQSKVAALVGQDVESAT